MIKHLLILGVVLLGFSMHGCRGKSEPPQSEKQIVEPDYSALETAIENDFAERKMKDSVADGQPAVKIGNQTWASYNLDVTTFKNGNPIQQAQSVEEFGKACDNGIPAWCFVDSDKNGGGHFGRMYNLAAVNDSRGLAPRGWHIPSSSEWQELVSFLGRDAEIKLKSKAGWITEDGNPANGSNETGFSVYPGGIRLGAGAFGAAFQLTGFWTTSPANAEYQYVVQFLSGPGINPSPMNKSGAYYIRLLHD